MASALYDLYSCLLVRLTQANLNNDAAALRECSALLTPLRNAWLDISPNRLAA